MTQAQILNVWCKIPDPKGIKANRLNVPICAYGVHSITFEKAAVQGKIVWKFPFDFRYQ